MAAVFDRFAIDLLYTIDAPLREPQYSRGTSEGLHWKQAIARDLLVTLSEAHSPIGAIARHEIVIGV
jgi:hypothetical protein